MLVEILSFGYVLLAGLVVLWAILLYIFYLSVIYPRYVSPLRHIPGPPLLPPSSIWSILVNLVAGQYSTILMEEAGIPQRRWMKQFGGEKGLVRAVGPLGVTRLIFLSPEACEQILIKSGNDYPRPRFIREALEMVVGYGLLTVEKDEHRQMRKMMNSAFSLPNLLSQIDKYYDAIESLCEILNQKLGATKYPDTGIILPVYEWTSRVTLDIICATAFDYYPDALHNPHNELAIVYENLVSLQNGVNFTLMMLVALIPGFKRFLGSRTFWRMRHFIKYIPVIAPISIVVDSMSTLRRISQRMLEEKMQENHESVMEQERKKDIMSLLVKAKKSISDSEPHGWNMTDAAMVDQVLTFLGAGHETTASGLAWTLYLLAKDKQAQKKLRDEVTPVFAMGSRPEYRILKDLPWLDSVVMESLRVLPPVPSTARITTKTGYIDGVLIPQNTLLYIPIRLVNTWRSVWGQDAEEFRPARWLDLPKTYNSQYSFMSFLFGPHSCIGKTMALIQMKTVLASLIARFEFDLAYENQVPQPTAAVTMKPKDSMPLRVRRAMKLEM